METAVQIAVVLLGFIICGGAIGYHGKTTEVNKPASRSASFIIMLATLIGVAVFWETTNPTKTAASFVAGLILGYMIVMDVVSIISGNGETKKYTFTASKTISALLCGIALISSGAVSYMA